MDVEQLAVKARDAQELISQGRRDFVALVREASRSGMSQRAIAQAVDRSQPEIARLLRFQGTSAQACTLGRNRQELIGFLATNKLSKPRIFGSVAKDNPTPDSDIDVLVTAQEPLSLLTQATIEQELTDMLGFPVDLVLDNQVRPDLRERIESEAIPL